MEIYVVQPGDNIELIASRYGIPVSDLIQYNELNNPYNLVPGQTIVIVFPQQTHMVKEGETLGEIAEAYGIPFMQLLRYNPYLANRTNIFPGETLIISYNANRDIITNGFTYPYINRQILIKTLPSLTYISVLNYRALAGGDVAAYYDDAEVINTAVDYGTIPLMMITTFSAQGEPNYSIAFDILVNETYQDNLINNTLKIIKEKVYYGVNIILNYINASNINLYNSFITKAANRIRSEGYIFITTIDPNFRHSGTDVTFEKIDYSTISKAADGISFTHFTWGQNMNPPGPNNSYSDYKQFLDYTVPFVQSDKISIGIPVVGYDWPLPYIEGHTVAKALTLHSAVSQAYDVGAEIQFDEPSRTPFYQYSQRSFGTDIEHIVWFVDARSIASIDELIFQYGLSGKGIWNIMVYYAEMWLLINSQFNVIKLIPDNL